VIAGRGRNVYRGAFSPTAASPGFFRKITEDADGPGELVKRARQLRGGLDSILADVSPGCGGALPCAAGQKAAAKDQKRG